MDNLYAVGVVYNNSPACVGNEGGKGGCSDALHGNVRPIRLGSEFIIAQRNHIAPRIANFRSC